MLDLAAIEKADSDIPCGPWKTYVNPMRDDGLFVHQDLPIEAYDGFRGLGGEKKYPATPEEGFGLGVQLPHKIAAALVLVRNELPALIREFRAARERIRELEEPGWRDAMRTRQLRAMQGSYLPAVSSEAGFTLPEGPIKEPK